MGKINVCNRAFSVYDKVDYVMYYVIDYVIKCSLLFKP